jgi:hypothetical protein
VPVTIRKDKPVPPSKRGSNPEFELPLADLLVGDMMQIDMPEEEVRQKINSIRLRAMRYGRANPPIKFTTRSIPEGVGIWRIK